MRFGLMVFPNHLSNGCATGENVVACSFYTASAINTALGGSTYDPVSSATTPIGESIAAAGNQASMNDATRKRFVILLTDGQPNCDTGTAGSSEGYAHDEVAKLLTKGVKTFVIGFGSGVDPTTLNDLATAGGTARSGTEKYYVANDTASLNTALDAIAQVASGELGAKPCDDSCYANGCPAGQICQQKFVSFGSVSMNLGECVADPCASKTCASDQFCRGGQCYYACTQGCAPGEVCKEGTCVSDPGPSTCTPACDRNLLCQGGRCIDDPCKSTAALFFDCPASAPVCESTYGGNCTAGDKSVDGGLIIDPTSDAGSGSGPGSGAAPPGCGCSTSGAMSSLAVLAALALARKRR
jgi:hypothetical protein